MVLFKSFFKRSSVRNKLDCKAWAKMFIFILLLYTIIIHVGQNIFLNILLLHFTESLYSVSEP